MSIETVSSEVKGPGDLDEFAAYCVDALRDLLAGDQYSGTRTRFLHAFAERAKYPWLGESGGPSDVEPGNELAYGLATAMARYSVPRVKGKHKYGPAQIESQQEVDKDQLLDAVDKVSAYPTAARLFGNALLVSGVFPPSNGKVRHKFVVTHLQHALEFYARDGVNAESADPW